MHVTVFDEALKVRVFQEMRKLPIIDGEDGPQDLKWPFDESLDEDFWTIFKFLNEATEKAEDYIAPLVIPKQGEVTEAAWRLMEAMAECNKNPPAGDPHANWGKWHLAANKLLHWVREFSEYYNGNYTGYFLGLPLGDWSWYGFTNLMKEEKPMALRGEQNNILHLKFEDLTRQIGEIHSLVYKRPRRNGHVRLFYKDSHDSFTVLLLPSNKGFSTSVTVNNAQSYQLNSIRFSEYQMVGEILLIAAGKKAVGNTPEARICEINEFFTV